MPLFLLCILLIVIAAFVLTIKSRKSNELGRAQEDESYAVRHSESLANTRNMPMSELKFAPQSSTNTPLVRQSERHVASIAGPTSLDAKTLRATALLTENIEWLKERWDVALKIQAGFLAATEERVLIDSSGTRKEKDAARKKVMAFREQIKAYKNWYFDPISENQLARLESDRLRLSTKGMTKGQASDLIGLLQPATDADKEILKFFKTRIEYINETRAPFEVARLMSDPISAAAWDARPADRILREHFRFYKMPIPRQLGHGQALRLIEEKEEALRLEGSPLPAEMDCYLTIISELLDTTICEDFDIKMPSLSNIRSAVDELRATGRSMEEISSNVTLVIDYLN